MIAFVGGNNKKDFGELGCIIIIIIIIKHFFYKKNSKMNWFWRVLIARNEVGKNKIK
jgi:hypothetical protein